MKRRFAIVLVLLAALLPGCASLRVEPSDHPAKKVAKVSARIPLAILTLGASEIGYACDRTADPLGCRRQAAAAYHQSAMNMREAQRRQQEAELRRATINALNASAARDRAAAFQTPYPTRSNCRTSVGYGSISTYCNHY